MAVFYDFINTLIIFIVYADLSRIWGRFEGFNEESSNSHRFFISAPRLGQKRCVLLWILTAVAWTTSSNSWMTMKSRKLPMVLSPAILKLGIEKPRRSALGLFAVVLLGIL